MIKPAILNLLFIFTYVMGFSPFVINTWKFSNGTERAWEILKNMGSAKDAITLGCTVCEEEQCDFTVGYGGSPDENGETTLDALIFDGTEMDMGAVGGLRRIKSAAKVARDVLDYTEHSILVGDLASNFAKQLGYKEESLSTNYSTSLHSNWKQKDCQPNFWKNVQPNPKKYCGPYAKSALMTNEIPKFSTGNHDTISMIAGDVNGNIVAGTSSNGATFKIPGRIGDAPLPGAGAYADSEVGGAAATGDGDIMMRFLPSFLAVEEMRRGSSPMEAANIAISRIVKKYPNFFGAVIAVNKKGEYGAACNGMDEFPFCIGDYESQEINIRSVQCSRIL